MSLNSRIIQARRRFWNQKTLGTNILVHCPSWRRGYVVLHITAAIQHCLKTEKEIPNQSAARIFAAATSILKAGTPAAGNH